MKKILLYALFLAIFTNVLIAQTETKTINNKQTIKEQETNNNKGDQNLRTVDPYWLNATIGRGIYFDAGNVGIGTPSPSTDLDVAGTIRTTGFILPGGNNGDVLTFNSLGSAYWAAPANGSSLWNEVGLGIIYKPSGSNVNVGIGVDTPNELLHVGGTILTEGGLKMLGSSNKIVFGNETSSTFQIARNLSTKGTSPPPEGSQVSILTINTDNNIGIGTNTPGVKLDVNGVIRTNTEFTFGEGHAGLISFGSSTNEQSLKIISNYNGGSKSALNGMAITSNGNIGIGLDNPAAKLHVDGNTITNSLQITGGVCQGDYVLSAADENGNAIWKDLNDLNIESAWNEDANGNIYLENGNVGIGTILPAAPLHLEFENSNVGIKFGEDSKSTKGGDAKGGEDFEIYTSFENESPYLNIYNSDYTRTVKVGWSIFTQGTGRDAKMLLEMDNTAGTSLTLKGKFYAQDGIGIGTTEIGSHALAVNGSINANEILVTETVPGSDYVFENDYSLMPLAELESFVKDNKHLPEVMSAKEFAEKGYNIGEMDDVLLRKVEELTLYIIQQQKEINGLKEKLENINN